MWSSTSPRAPEVPTVPFLAHRQANEDTRHIVVTGAMGVGKSTVGRLLAEELDLPFLDSDEVLESRTGEVGADIAFEEGVERLHELELAAFLEMCQTSERSVIAPASSVVDHRDGRDAMAENITVWLTAPDQVVALRQGPGGHRRPMDGEERAELREKRAPHLEAVSEFTIDAGSATPEEVVREVKDRL